MEERVERAILRRAWLPTRCDDGRWCWLRRYRRTERLVADHGGGSAGHWVPTGRTAPDHRLVDVLEYRVLRAIAPGEPAYLSGALYARRSKVRTLLGDEVVQRMAGADVLDFGCGAGAEAIEVARLARSVYGLDIQPRLVAAAREAAEAAGVSDRCTFGAQASPRSVDYIYSLDSFEHFGDPAGVLRMMYDQLRPGGQVFISFGPTWYHPLGGHLFSVFPWAHLLFSEAALLRWRSHIRADRATRFSEVEGGLNQMTIRRFEALVAASSFRVVSLTPVPIRAFRRVHSRLTREWTTATVRCVLERPSSG